MTAPAGGDGETTDIPTTTAAEWEGAVLLAREEALCRQQLPPDWDARTETLLALLIGAAIAKGVATRAHAQAWLAAEGPGVQREQVAKLAASGAVLAADVTRARVEAYRLLLDSARLADLSEPPDGHAA